MEGATRRVKNSITPKEAATRYRLNNVNIDGLYLDNNGLDNSTASLFHPVGRFF
jgi:hypothetical protein